MNARTYTNNAQRDLNRDLVTRAASIASAGLVLICLLLPLSQATADARPASESTERLEWLLTTHDIRHAIHAPAKTQRSGDSNKREHAR